MTSEEARHLTRYLREHRICKPFSKAALARGTKIEKREHPGFTKADARRIARDHLCAKGDRAYPPGGHRFGAFRPMPGTEGGRIKFKVRKPEGVYIAVERYGLIEVRLYKRGEVPRTIPFSPFDTVREARTAVRSRSRSFSAFGGVWKSGRTVKVSVFPDFNDRAHKAVVSWPGGGPASFMFPKSGRAVGEEQIARAALTMAIRDRESGLVKGERTPQAAYRGGALHLRRLRFDGFVPGRKVPRD